MNGHAVPGSFLARTNSPEIVVAKFEGVIIRLKELCSHMDIIVETKTTTTVFECIIIMIMIIIIIIIITVY